MLAGTGRAKLDDDDRRHRPARRAPRRSGRDPRVRGRARERSRAARLRAAPRWRRRGHPGLVERQWDSSAPDPRRAIAGPSGPPVDLLGSLTDVGPNSWLAMLSPTDRKATDRAAQRGGARPRAGRRTVVGEASGQIGSSLPGEVEQQCVVRLANEAVERVNATPPERRAHSPPLRVRRSRRARPAWMSPTASTRPCARTAATS